MNLAEFAIAPKRDLSEAQETRLNRFYCTGDIGGGAHSTVVSLVVKGILVLVDRQYKITEHGRHYLFHYGAVMPI